MIRTCNILKTEYNNSYKRSWTYHSTEKAQTLRTLVKYQD